MCGSRHKYLPGQADGSPACLLYVQDSNQLMNSDRLSQRQDGTKYSLVLTDVAPNDAGVYTCLARNAGGQVLCKAELLVHGGELLDSCQVLGRVQGPGSSPRPLCGRTAGPRLSSLPVLYINLFFDRRGQARLRKASISAKTAFLL